MRGEAGGDSAEIVIVRRRMMDDSAGGKAGAWKIAYADFVTAMMAFFLVMWLINASNEETRAQVASYFNPIKLTDSSTGARSLKDMKDTRSQQNRQSAGPGQGAPPSEKDMKEEAEMMSDPPHSLDRIAEAVSSSRRRNAGVESDAEVAPSMRPDASNPGVGDPFDPRSWEKNDLTESAKASSADEGKASMAERKQEPAASTGRREGPVMTGKAPDEIVQDIADRLGADPQELHHEVEVRTKGSGLLVSLTENADFEMFKNGSAEPEPQMLKLMDAIAGALKTRPGAIIIRGHTDSRPFRNKYYDNWQLSTARANLARYMLIRGGVEENRIRRVEGVADLEPKNSHDPQAPENRRIEIFVGTEAP